ncbi:MAG TPA: DUF4112 domain-containing protein [Candidatus Limnocylindria bacterium]|jgi:hypothetical protein|nr:DUF4112 domain-containing protein [Candidatus Limnocylindria bacterium]
MARLTRADRQSVADAELIAWLLDNSIPIPGTGRRIGLDAVIGLVPGLGDILAGGLGLLIVARAVQRGLPTVVLARMLANVALDFAIGSVPIIGDAFDLWYKSNARNVALLRRYADNPSASTAGQWAFFLGLLAVIGAMAIGFVWLVWAALSALFG